MSKLGGSDEDRRTLWWLVATAATFVSTGLVLSSASTALADICDPSHESPNTPLGWSIVILGTIVVGLIGWLLRPPRRALLASAAATLHLLVFAWLIASTGS